jgi:hypothetical protein
MRLGWKLEGIAVLRNDQSRPVARPVDLRRGLLMEINSNYGTYFALNGCYWD